MDIFALREIERMVIVLGAVFTSYLGYRLFNLGVTTQASHMSAEGSGIRFSLSGTGPGLFFMAFGSIVLIAALLSPLTERITSGRQAASDAVSAGDTPPTAASKDAVSSGDTPPRVQDVVVSERKLGGTTPICAKALGNFNRADLVEINEGQLQGTKAAVDHLDLEHCEVVLILSTGIGGNARVQKQTQARPEQVTRLPPDKNLKPGDKVTVLFGTFANFQGTIEHVYEEEYILTLRIKVFGKETSLPMPLSWARKIF